MIVDNYYRRFDVADDQDRLGGEIIRVDVRGQLSRKALAKLDRFKRHLPCENVLGALLEDLAVKGVIVPAVYMIEC